MTSFAAIYRGRVGLGDRYLALVRDAQEKRDIEYAAALKIERTWRRHRARQQQARRNRMATIIQRTFRKHQARILVECLRVEKAHAERLAYFNIMATRIQKLWRGYNSRRKGNVAGPEPAVVQAPSVFQPAGLTGDRAVTGAVGRFLKDASRNKVELPGFVH